LATICTKQKKYDKIIFLSRTFFTLWGHCGSVLFSWAVSLLVPHDVLDPLRDIPVPLHVPHVLPGPLREVFVLLCAPEGVPERLKHVHLQFLDLTKTGKMSILAHFLMR
jgi:hypothetical protein